MQPQKCGETVGQVKVKVKVKTAKPPTIRALRHKKFGSLSPRPSKWSLSFRFPYQTSAYEFRV
jgi:hypothetical protein